MTAGRIAILLHAHLPFVRHPEHEEFLEERWLFEAITETYLPLLDVLAALDRDRVPARFTLSLSPPLLGMLSDALLLQRYRRHMDRLLRLAAAEERRTRPDPPLHRNARFYLERLGRAREAFLVQWQQDLPGAFRGFQEREVVELITCAGTHPVLPLLGSPVQVRAHVEVAAAEYRRFFARRAAGFWLPECAYRPGLEHELRRAGFRWFVVDTHGLVHATPRPLHGVYAPVLTPAGVAAYARDPESSKQVWSAAEGYPGDVWYRDFYRDAGFEAPPDALRSIWPDAVGTHTGLKYWRITGKTDAKAPYERARALERVEVHAAHFVEARRAQAEALARSMGRPPLVLCPYDAELFGHWWFEGPEWLLAVLRRMAATPGLLAATPSDDLAAQPVLQRAVPAASTWGQHGYHDVWIASQNDWIYPKLHAAAARLEAVVRRHPGADDVTRRALTQALRSLMIAQASDWAFMMSRETTAAYGVRRTEEMLARCHALCEQVERGAVDEAGLSAAEARDNLFPVLDYRILL